MLCVPCVEAAPLQRVRFPTSPTLCRLSVRASLLLLSSPASMDGWMSCWKTTGIDRTCCWRILGRDSTSLDGFCRGFGGERRRERRMTWPLWSGAALAVILTSVSLILPDVLLSDHMPDHRCTHPFFFWLPCVFFFLKEKHQRPVLFALNGPRVYTCSSIYSCIRRALLVYTRT